MDLNSQITTYFKNGNTTLYQEFLNRKNDPGSYIASSGSKEKPKGKLVKASILPNPYTEISRDLKTFANAMQGEGTDYSIGKLNDTALAASTALIAAALAGGQKLPHKMAMEFVGAAGWLSSMHIWPKVFINQPVKMLTGVDNNLEYINSQNERKPFFLDGQYIPWDLMDKEKLENAGRKLGVPQHIENRDEEIKSRMRKVAVGTNTWWLLTAGFSTPIMASAFSSLVEKPVETLSHSLQISSAEKNLKKALYVNHKLSDKDREAFEKLLDKKELKLNEVKEFFYKKYKGEHLEDFRTAVAHRVNTIFTLPNNKRLQDLNLIRDKKDRNNRLEELRKLHKNADKSVAINGAFSKYAKAFEDSTGSLSTRLRTQILDILGFSSKEIKDLKFVSDPAKKSEIIAKRVIQIAEEGKTNEVLKKLDKAIAPVAEQTIKAHTLINRASKNILEIAHPEGDVFKDFTKYQAKLHAQKAADKAKSLAGFDRMKRLVELAGDRSEKTWAPLMQGFKEMGYNGLDDIGKVTHQQRVSLAANALNSVDTWDRMVKDFSPDRGFRTITHSDEFIKGLYGVVEGKTKGLDGVLENVKTFSKAPAMALFDGGGKTSKIDLAPRIPEWTGEAPTQMLSNISNSVYNSKVWKQRVLYTSGGLVLATTAAMLLWITNNAQKPTTKGKQL